MAGEAPLRGENLLAPARVPRRIEVIQGVKEGDELLHLTGGDLGKRELVLGQHDDHLRRVIPHEPRHAEKAASQLNPPQIRTLASPVPLDRVAAQALFLDEDGAPADGVLRQRNAARGGESAGANGKKQKENKGALEAEASVHGVSPLRPGRRLLPRSRPSASPKTHSSRHPATRGRRESPPAKFRSRPRGCRPTGERAAGARRSRR